MVRIGGDDGGGNADDGDRMEGARWEDRSNLLVRDRNAIVKKVKAVVEKGVLNNSIAMAPFD